VSMSSMDHRDESTTMAAAWCGGGSSACRRPRLVLLVGRQECIEADLCGPFLPSSFAVSWGEKTSPGFQTYCTKQKMEFDIVANNVFRNK
jgi:hypothetical protein